MSLESNTASLQNILDTVNNLPNARLTSAVTYYVSSSGSDSNAGTQDAPFKTINHALEILPKDLGGCKATIQALSDISERISISYFFDGILEINMGSYVLTGRVHGKYVLADIRMVGNTYTAESSPSGQVIQFHSCFSVTLWPYSGTTITVNCGGGMGFYANNSTVFLTTSPSNSIVFNNSSHCVYAQASKVSVGGILSISIAEIAISAQQAAIIALSQTPTFSDVTTKYAYQGGLIITGSTVNPPLT